MQKGTGLHGETGWLWWVVGAVLFLFGSLVVGQSLLTWVALIGVVGGFIVANLSFWFGHALALEIGVKSFAFGLFLLGAAAVANS